MSILSDITSGWSGTVLMNDKPFDGNASGAITLVFSKGITKEKEEPKKENSVIEATGTYRITVKPYMTKKATPEFDFMAKWNNDNPMPLMTMVGEKVKETKGMVYMELHGDITAEITDRCLACGKPITNPVSRYFGMGPVCGGHNYVSPFADDESLKAAVGEYRKKLQSITWSGWVIKSAITEEVEL